MIQVDMHVHSKYSRHTAGCLPGVTCIKSPSVGVEEVYDIAKARGMTYVTLTDLNTIDGALELHARHPADTFISAEVASYFPEYGSKVNVLVYGISRAQFGVIKTIRQDIRKLRDYLRRENIACSAAPEIISFNDLITLETIEKLVLLFDVFEGMSGGRTDVQNRAWVEALQALTPAHIVRLSRKHGIDPWGHNSWVKGLTGGSDDRAGRAIGQTVTLACDATISQFLDQVRRGEARPAGRHADREATAYQVNTIGREVSRGKRKSGADSPLALLCALLFDNGPLGLPVHRT